jgi:hypothetical protein
MELSINNYSFQLPSGSWEKPWLPLFIALLFISVFFCSAAHLPLSLRPASTAPKHRSGRFLPRPAPSHSYNLRPIRGRDRIPINLVSDMSSDPSAPLPSSPSAPSLSQASASLPLAAVPSTVPSTGYVPPGTSSVPLTLDSLVEVVREISRNMAVMQGNMIAMQGNISSIHTYITGAQNPPLPPLPHPPRPGLRLAYRCT